MTAAATSARFASQGRARDDNNFSFDGVDAGGIQEQAQKSQTRLQISEDAIEEYRVNSALYDAEYGTQAGGQINVVTKSGTNDFHGTVFGYLRNSVLDARNFNDPPTIPPFRMGQYGLTIGGPYRQGQDVLFHQLRRAKAIPGTNRHGRRANPVIPSAGSGHGRTDRTWLFYAADPALMCPILQAFPWQESTGTVGTCAPRFVFADSLFTPVDPGSLPSAPDEQ